MIFKNLSKRIPLLIVADLVAFFIAVNLSSATKKGIVGWAIGVEPILIVAVLMFPVLFYVFDLYFPYKLFKPGLTFFEVTLAVVIGGLILASLSYFDRDFSWGRRPFILTLFFYTILVFALRILYDRVFKSRFLDKPTLIIGTGHLAKSVLHAIEITVHSGLKVIGVVVEGDERVETGEKWRKLDVLGNFKQIRAVIRAVQPQLVILALDEAWAAGEPRSVSEIALTGIQITSGVYLLERLTGTVPDQWLGNHVVLSIVAQARTRPYLKIKRIFDVISAAVLLVITTPVWGLTLLGLSFDGVGRIFFVQERLGLNGKPFKLYKFRSMTSNQNGDLNVTKIGKWLRKYRIDELPQIVNVLKGDMSLVGPRPEIDYFVKRSIAKIPMYEAVFAIKPGLTGWAQVKFRYTTSVKDYHEKFRYNLYYLKHMSFMLDVLIIFKTIRIVLLGLGR